MSIQIRHISDPSEEEMLRAANVLHEAFGKQYFLGALGGNQSLVEPFLLGHVKAAVIGGNLYVAELPNEGIVGVALWFGPGQKFLGSSEQLNAGWNQTMDQLNETARKWWDKFLIFVDEVAEKIFGDGQKLASYHLQTFGVLPDHQKKGYGTLLMKTVQQKAAKESTTVTVETMGESAVPIYKGMGFQVIGPVVVDTPSGAKANAYGFKVERSLPPV
ncbi:hypothetical protein M422DRAFT_211995 [Sphaerobolus stellatus SS14]|uniref:N-acetyltransferase domain-containing protein n=1 Tax=Sphaerobolus stellatus (strain SS14) TaxID=990650 RepID=A0A0C9VGH1_SPHS4|nr:hypothetical protein M422DRAFT_211995 [Sphaerobolus stellatus SS14]